MLAFETFVDKSLKPRYMNFLFEFQIPQPMPADFTAQIPEQRAEVNRLMAEGDLVSYSVSMDRAKLWVVIEAASESGALDIIAELPLTSEMKMQMHPLLFHNSMRFAPPAISLN